MADIANKTYYSLVRAEGFSPALPPSTEDPESPINPPGVTPTNPVDHNSTLNKQGGDEVLSEFYHLTKAQYDALTVNDYETRLLSQAIVQWSGVGYIFNCSALSYKILGVFKEIGFPTNVELNAPDATHPRIDAIYVDADEVVKVRTGTPSVSPSQPTFNSNTEIALTYIYVPEASSEPNLTELVIYNENIESTYSSSGTGTANPADTAKPYQGAVAVKVTGAANGFVSKFALPANVNLTDYTSLGLHIELLAIMKPKDELILQWLDAADALIGNPVNLPFNKGSNDSSVVNNYQFAAISTSVFGTGTTLVRSLRITYKRSGAGVHTGWRLDVIKLEGGIAQPTPQPNLMAGAGLSIDSVGRVQFGKVDLVDEIAYLDLTEYNFPSNKNLSISTNYDASKNFNSNFSYLYLNELSDGRQFSGIESNFNNGSTIHNIATVGLRTQNDDALAFLSIFENVGSNEKSIALDFSAMTVTDQINSKGLEYAGDYEANFTARSLVTKQYVDGAIPAPVNVLATPLTGYVVGSNTALTASNTVLQGFQNLQGQVNARVSGGATAGLVSYGVSPGTIGASTSFLYDNTNKILTVGNSNEASSISIGGTGTRGNLQLSNPFLNSGTFSRYVSIGNNILINSSGSLSRISTTIGGGIIGIQAQIATDGILDFFAFQNSDSTINRELRITTNSSIFRGSLGLGNVIPTNTLDINGTLRVRTVNALGTAPTTVWVGSATGVLSSRTLAEFRGDLSAVPTSRTLTINGTVFDLNANRSWTIPTHDAVTIGTANGLSLAGQVLSLGLASSGVTGALSGTDWNTFNAKQNAIAGTLTNGFVATLVSGIATWAAPSLVVDTNKVSYNVADSKTASEKLQARVNIGSTSATPQVIVTAGAINDLVTTSNHLVFTGASVVLSGIVAGLDGEEFTILNASGTNLELLSQSALSVAGNRFASGVIVPNLSTVRIKYRATTARWVLENVGINDGRYVRKDVADTKTGNLTLSNGCIVNGFLDVNGSASASPGVALNRIRNAVAPSGITQFFGTNGGSSRQHFAFYGSGDVEYISFGNGWISSGVPTARFVNAVLLQGNASASVRSVNNTFLTRRDELYLNYSQTVATTGTINNLAINSDCKLLILTGADDLTGVVAVDNTRLLRIEARGASRIIRHESASSTAANRFSIGADLTINAGEVYQFIYTDSRWRRIL